MKLVSCEIAGFGRLKELNIDFKEGLNACIEENGWGKTTLTVFLKAMLYGMDYSRRRTLTERAHYEPWDGTRYGGSLTFEAGGRKYRVERTFGKKDTADTFALYDAKTGLLSGDYGKDLGEELFGVDRDSFEKSIFFPQNSLATGMTDALNAKMGNIASAQDDINHFDAAMGRLEDARRVYARNSRVDPGRLPAVRREIQECREALEQLPTVTDALSKQRNMLEEKRGKLEEKLGEKEALAEQIVRQSRREQEVGIYREKKENLDKVKEAIANSLKIFKDREPEEDQLAEMEECERQVEIDGKRLDAIRHELPREEEVGKLTELFDGREITDELLDEWDDKAERMLKLRLKSEHMQLQDQEKAQLAELSVYFSKKDPTEEQLEQAMADAAELAQLEGQAEMLHEQYRNIRARAAVFRETPRESGSPRASFYGALAAVVLLAGAIAFQLLLGGSTGGGLAAVCVLAAAAVVAVMVVITARRRQAQKRLIGELDKEIDTVREAFEEKERERDSKKETCRAFLAGFLVTPADSYAQMIGEVHRKKEIYRRLKERENKAMADASGTLEELSALQVELYTALTPYAEVYGIDLYETTEEIELVEKLKQDVVRYRLLCELLKEQKALGEHVGRLDERVKEFLSRFPLEGASDKEKLLELRRRWDQYAGQKQLLLELEEEIRRFEEDSRIHSETRSVTQLQEAQVLADEEIGELNRQILKAQETENELADQVESLDEVGERLEALMVQEREYVKKVELYDETIRYLTRAKELFMKRYIGALREGLVHYLSVLGISKEGIMPALSGFTLDMDLSVSLNHRGSLKSADYLSSGYRDLVAVCARLALVDALYDREKPFLLMDDSFVNLDEPKLEGAKGLLRQLAKTRQVIYFTCHESRLP